MASDDRERGFSRITWLSTELQQAFDGSACHKLGFVEEEHLAKELSSFYDKVIEESAMV